MKLNWFQIKNFRSIVDSGQCHVGKDITILAGKNESGKSNILKSLNAFNHNSFDEADYAIDEVYLPSVTACFSCKFDEIAKIARQIFDLDDEYVFEHRGTSDDYFLKVTRSANVDEQFEGSVINTLKSIMEEEYNFWDTEVTNKLEEVSNLECIPDEVAVTFDDKDRNLTEITNSAIKMLSELRLSQQIENDQKLKINKIYDYLTANEDLIEIFDNEFDVDQMPQFVPNFILFDSFSDILPDEANEDDVEESTIINRFFKIVGVSPIQIFETEVSQKRKQIVNRISNSVSGDFGTFYTQNDVVLQIDVDGEKIQFYVYDGNSSVPFHPNQRSQGFQWFLSFYLTLKAESLSENSIILIDEPGIYLHPTAQIDMLHILESISDKNQILFTTHSPYLIDSDRLDRVRLVIKHHERTYIENKIHKGADTDTLKPIISAIGYNFNHGIRINPNLNIITEGISDYYYLLSIIKIIVPKSDYNFTIIPAVGASQVPNIASILFGWGVQSIALFDNDQEGKRMANKLITKLGFEVNKNIIYVSSINGESIEDIFSQEDFHKYVLLESNNNITEEKNSKIVGERKVFLAKSFYDYVSSNEHLDFSEDTKTRFTELLTKLVIIR